MGEIFGVYDGSGLPWEYAMTADPMPPADYAERFHQEHVMRATPWSTMQSHRLAEAAQHQIIREAIRQRQRGGIRQSIPVMREAVSDIPPEPQDLEAFRDAISGEPPDSELRTYYHLRVVGLTHYAAFKTTKHVHAVANTTKAGTGLSATL